MGQDVECVDALEAQAQHLRAEASFMLQSNLPRATRMFGYESLAPLELFDQVATHTEGRPSNIIQTFDNMNAALVWCAMDFYTFLSFVKVFRQEETHFVGTTLVWCAMKRKSFYIFLYFFVIRQSFSSRRNTFRGDDFGLVCDEKKKFLLFLVLFCHSSKFFVKKKHISWGRLWSGVRASFQRDISAREVTMPYLQSHRQLLGDHRPRRTG
jgi:hypothetical protein